MAESRNPADNAELRRLESALEGTVSELKAELAQAREERVQAQQVQERQTARAQRETQARRARTAGTRAGEVPDTEVLPADLERGAAARERGAKAAKASAEAARTENALLRERTALPRAGGTGGGYFGGLTPAEARARAEMAGLQTGGRGGGGQPPAPPVLVPGAGGQPERRATSLRESIGAYQRQAAAERGVATATAAMDAELAASIQMQAQASNSMRRHGALTTEFFEALARGEVTLAELRYQLGSTIAKFGGWTAASVAVFGVVDAFRELGKGAIDSSSGVAVMQAYIDNLDTDKAQQQLVDLSHHFNLPIDQVADAMARMGQVFHNQDDAFQAAKAALYGVKVGQLDVGDSTRYLISIVQGAHLPASQLGVVFDQINQAQNRFGVTIRDAAAGTAKATGAWVAAGGSLHQLLALITTGQRVTGRSGEDIGTALQRSAEVIFRRPINKQQLQGFGISTAQSLTQIYEQAFRLVDTGKVRGRHINALAAALSTPQLAPRISAILQNRRLYNQVFSGLDESHARGSAESELQKRLRSAREEVGRLGTDLQQIGAELARAGAGAGPMLLLKTLEETLHVTTQLLALFNELPRPLRTAAVSALEIYGATRLLRRFGVGGALGGLLPSGRERIAARQAARAPVTFYEAELERSTARLSQARLQQAVVEDRIAALEAEGLVGTERFQAALNARTAAETAAADAALASATVQRKLAQARVGAGIETTAATAAAGAGGAAAGAGAGALERDVALAAGGALGVNLLPAEQARRELGRFTGVTRQLLDGASSMFGLTSAGAVVATGRGAALKAGLTRFGLVLRGILSDPLLAGVGAFFAAEAIKSHLDARGRKYDQLGAGPRSAGEADAILHTRDTSAQAQQAANIELEIRQRQAQERAAGKPVAQLFTGQIRHEAHDTLNRLQQGRISRDEAVKELNRQLKEVDLSRSSDPLKELARVDLNRMKRGLGPAKGQTLRQIWDSRSLKEFQQQLQQDTLAITSYGFRRARLQDVAAAYESALHAARKSPTAYNVNRLQAAQQAINAIASDITSTLDADLKAATTAHQRQQAFERALAHARELPRGQQRSRLVQQVRQQRYTTGLELYDAETEHMQAQTADPLAQARILAQRSDERLAHVQAAYRKGLISEKDLWAALDKRSQAYQQLAQQQETEFQGRQELAASQFALSVGGAQGPILRHAVQDAQSLVSYVRAQGSKLPPSALRDALKGLAGAKLAVVQYVREQGIAMLQATEAYQEAGIDPADTAAIDRLKLREAQREARKYPALDAAGRKQQQANIRGLQAQGVRDQQQSAFDDIEFMASIGKITRDVEIQRLQGLLKTIKNNKALKRQIQQQIYQLQQESAQDAGGDIDIGNIRLPTVYEIRRAIQGAQQGGVAVTNHNTIQMNVASGADVDTVFAKVDQITGSSLKAAARSAGLR